MKAKRTDWEEIAAWGWVVFQVGRVLHHVAALDDPAETELYWIGEGRTSCGRRGLLFLPGMGTRLAAARCQVCCRATGYPPGIGSPKNDRRLYMLVKAEMESSGPARALGQGGQ